MEGSQLMEFYWLNLLGFVVLMVLAVLFKRQGSTPSAIICAVVALFNLFCFFNGMLGWVS
jgi:hypothetical protein